MIKKKLPTEGKGFAIVTVKLNKEKKITEKNLISNEKIKKLFIIKKKQILTKGKVRK